VTKVCTANSWFAVFSIFVLASCDSTIPEISERGDPTRGKQIIEQAGCGSCHFIPGISTANGKVGPPLDDLARRGYLAGVLPNNFDNLVLWVAQPQTVAPASAMPNLGLSEAQAQDVAAYLYTLR
jgi:cytochrome c